MPSGPGWGCEVSEDVLREHPVGRREPRVGPAARHRGRRGRTRRSRASPYALSPAPRTSAATPLLVAACALVLLPYLPVESADCRSRVAVTPALGLASFAALVTTVSLLGAPLDSVSIPLVVAAFVVPLALGSLALENGTARDRAPRVAGRRSRCSSHGVVAFALASSLDIAYPFQARGTDWGHYLLYAERSGAGSPADRRSVRGGGRSIFGDPPAVGAVYGSFSSSTASRRGR